MQHSRLLDPIYTFAKLSIFISNEDLRDDMMILIFNSSNVTTQDKTNFVQEKNKTTGQASTTERDRLDHLFILANYDLTSRTTREEEACLHMQKIPEMDYYAQPRLRCFFSLLGAHINNNKKIGNSCVDLPAQPSNEKIKNLN